MVMKILLKFIIVPLFIVFIFKCSDDNISTPDDNLPPNDTTKYYSVSGIVFDVVSDEYSPGVKKNAPIFIDNDSTISGDDGKFTFNKISEGNHTISISLPEYEPFSKTITIPNDTIITIYIYGVKSDYFPIHENNQILFNYRFSSTNLVTTIVDEGTALWNVNSVNIVNIDTIYNLQETLIYVRTTNGVPSTQQDTIISSFQIIEDSSKKITINSSFLNLITFSRYMDPRQEQGGLIYKSYNTGSSTINISLKKNVGFIKINQTGNRWGKTYERTQ
jgi:hypothetical protein